MSAKILKICLIVFAVFLLAACADKQEVVYVDRYKTVKVPVMCKTPDVECDFNRTTYTEVVGAMLECIVDLRRANEVCK